MLGGLLFRLKCFGTVMGSFEGFTSESSRRLSAGEITHSLPGISIATWVAASVIAHEYPSRWVQIVAYGTAGAVSITRYSSFQHFPADAFVGSVLGYFVGQHIFHSHCGVGLSKKLPHQGALATNSIAVTRNRDYFDAFCGRTSWSPVSNGRFQSRNP